MSDFNYQDYLRNNPLLKREVKEEKLITENMVADEDIEKEIKTLEDENPKGFAKEISRLKTRQALIDLMKKAKAKDEVSEIEESALAVAAGVASVFGGAAALTKIIDKLEKGDLGEKGKKLASTLASMGKAASQVRNEEIEEGNMPIYDEDDTDPVKEDARTDAEQEGYKDGFEDAEDDMEGAMKKMKVSELKAKIKEDIVSLLQEEEEDVEVEDEIEVDIEEPALDAEVAQSGLSDDEKEIQDSLKLAYDNALAIGDQKLADQIGNSITFFTRTHVVER